MSTPPAAAFPPPGRLLEAAGLPRRVHEALELALELVDERIVAAIARALPPLADQVNAITEYGSRHRVTLDMVDAPKRLLRDGAAMSRLFLAGIERELAALRDPQAAPAGVPTDKPATGFGELRLVDEDDEDIDTVLGGLALRHESRAALAVQLLCQRFGVLAAAPAFEPGTLVVGPRRLSELLVEACTLAGFGMQLTVAVVREFDRVVLPGYPLFAETLNGLLSRLGVMPGLSYVPLRRGGRTPDEVREDIVADATGLTSAAAATGGASPGAPRPAPDAQGTAPASRSFSEPALSRPLAEPRDHAGDPAAPAFEALQAMLMARRGLAERFRGSGMGERGRAHLDTHATLDLLAQADATQVPGDFDALRQWVLVQGRQRRGEAVALAAPDADAFELLGLLYGGLAGDVRADAPTTKMFDQLRVPLARVALSDHAFFEQPDHPARQLLETVARTAAPWTAPDDVDPQFLQHVQQVVEAVARTRGDVRKAFSNAAETIDAQQQLLVRRAEMAERRSVEAARGKEKLAVARRRAAHVIDNAMQGLQLPAFHRTMLRQAWADVLTLAHLRHGEEAEEWVALVGDTRDLARAGARDAPAPEGLAAQVEQWLVTVGHHAEDAARMSRVLTDSQQAEQDDAASRTELTMRLKARARLGEDAAKDAPATAPRTAAEEVEYRRLRQVPFGAWIGLTAEDGTVQRRRLAWWSPSTDSALLVNARGQRVADTTLDALARELAAGRASLVPPDEPGFVDRAWRAVVNSLRAIAPQGVARKAAG